MLRTLLRQARCFAFVFLSTCSLNESTGPGALRALPLLSGLLRRLVTVQRENVGLTRRQAHRTGLASDWHSSRGKSEDLQHQAGMIASHTLALFNHARTKTKARTLELVLPNFPAPGTVALLALPSAFRCGKVTLRPKSLASRSARRASRHLDSLTSLHLVT